MYNIEYRLQPYGIKIIEDLENMVYWQFIKFYEKINTLPRKIIYFRDGTNKSTFLQSLEYEFIAIKRACLRLYRNYKPPITIIVIKKHQLKRMFTNQMFKRGDVDNGYEVNPYWNYWTNILNIICSHYAVEVSYSIFFNR